MTILIGLCQFFDNQRSFSIVHDSSPFSLINNRQIDSIDCFLFIYLLLIL